MHKKKVNQIRKKKKKKKKKKVNQKKKKKKKKKKRNQIPTTTELFHHNSTSGAATRLLPTSKNPTKPSKVLILNIKIRKTAAVLVVTVCSSKCATTNSHTKVSGFGFVMPLDKVSTAEKILSLNPTLFLTYY